MKNILHSIKMIQTGLKLIFNRIQTGFLIVFLIISTSSLAQWKQTNIKRYINSDYSFTLDKSKIYLNGGSYGLFVSEDTAKTWKRFKLENISIFQSVADGPNIIATQNSYYYDISNDYGVNWLGVNNNSYYYNNMQIYNHNIYSSDRNKIYITSESGVLLNSVNNNLQIIAFAAGKDTIFISSKGYYDDKQGCLLMHIMNENKDYRTEINTKSIIKIVKQGQKFVCLTADSMLYTSANNGKTWKLLNQKYVNLMTFSSKFILINKFQNNKNKLLYSSDLGDNFIELNTNESISGITDMKIMGNTFIIGTKFNGIFTSSDFGKNWENIMFDVNNIGVSQIAAKQNKVISLNGENNTIISDDNGDNWYNVFDGISANQARVTSITSDENKIYTIDYNNNIYYFDESIGKWVFRDSLPYKGSFKNFAVSNNAIVANNNNDLIFSKNKNIYLKLKIPFRAYDYAGIYIHFPYIYCYSENFSNYYLSPDSGKTWQQINNKNGLNCNIVYCMAYNNGKLYIGTDNGLYQSSDNGISCIKKGIINNIYDISFYENYLLVLTDDYYFDNNYCYSYSKRIFFSDDDGLHYYALPSIYNMSHNSYYSPNINNMLVSNNDILVTTYNRGIWKFGLGIFNKGIAILNYKDTIKLCKNDTYVLQASFPGAKHYQWQFMKPGNNFYDRINSDTSFYTAMNEGNYRVIVNDSSNNTFFSKAIYIVKLPLVSANIVSSSGPALCKGQSIKLTVDSIKYKSGFNWVKDGQNIQGATNTTYTVTSNGAYYLLLNDSCGNNASNTIIIYKDSLPEVNIAAIGKTTICKGNPINLHTEIKNNYIDEDFETANVYKYPWKNESVNKWKITTDSVCKGKYSLSVSIINTPASYKESNTLCNSTLEITLLYPQNDSISFYVNSNLSTWKWLEFYINGNRVNEWNKTNGWEKVTFYVSAGYNTFSWNYSNYDYSNYYPYNIVRLDNIMFSKYSKWNYQWTKDNKEIKGAVSPSYTANDQGIYTLKVSNNCSSVTSSPFTIKTYPPPDTNIIVIKDTSNNCRIGAATITAKNTKKYRYKWTYNGMTAPQDSGKANYYADVTGNYGVMIIDSNNCSLKSGNRQISIRTKIDKHLDYSANNNYCQDYPKIITAVKDTGLIYQWLYKGEIIPGATNSSYTAKNTGNYNVKISDNKCSEMSDTVMVRTHPSTAVIDVLNDANLCMTSSKVSYLSTFTKFNDGFEPDNTYFGDHNFWGMDYGNWGEPWFVLDNIAHSGSYSAMSGKISNSYTNLYLTLMSNKDDTLSFFYKNQSSNNFEFRLYQNANYIRKILTMNTDWTKVSVPVSAGYVDADWLVNGTNDEGALMIDDVQLGYTANQSYQWQKNGTNIQGATDNVYTANEIGYYSVNITDDCGMISSRNLKVIDSCYYYYPTIVMSDTTDNKCTTGSKLLKLEGASGCSFAWYFNDKLIASDTTNKLFANKTGTYKICATNNSYQYCQNNININIIPAFSSTAIIKWSPQYLCEGDEVTLYSNSDSTNDISWQWYKEGKIINGATNSALNINNSKNYTVSVTFDNQCNNMSKPFSVKMINHIPKPELVNYKSLSCLSDSVKLMYNTTYYESFEEGTFENNNTAWTSTKFPWSVVSYRPYKGKYCAISGLINSNNKSDFQITVNLKQSDSLTFYYLINNNSANILNVNVNNVTVLTFTNTDDNFKSGQWQRVSYYLNAGNNKILWSFYNNSNYESTENFVQLDEIRIGSKGDLDFQWLRNGIAIPEADNYYYYVKDTGVYKLRISNACEAYLSDSIKILKGIRAEINPKINMKICGDSTINLYAINISEALYQWQQNSINIAGATSSSYSTNVTGNYRVLETISNGCSDTSTTTNITFNPLPVIKLKKDTTICGEKVYLVDGGYGFVSYLWSTGERTQKISIDTSGVGFGIKEFSLKITDRNGCTAIAFGKVNFINCTGIEELTNTIRINVIPNPSDGNITLEIRNPSKSVNEYKMEVFDCIGKRLYVALLSDEHSQQVDKAESRFSINLSYLSKGLYFINFNNDKVNYSTKIVIL